MLRIYGIILITGIVGQKQLELLLDDPESDSSLSTESSNSDFGSFQSTTGKN